MQGPIRTPATPSPRPLKAPGSVAHQHAAEPHGHGKPCGLSMQGDALRLSAGATAPKGTSSAAEESTTTQATPETPPDNGTLKVKTTVSIMELVKPAPPAPHMTTVQEALASKASTPFTNSIGQTESIRIASAGEKDGEDAYDVQVGEDRFKLRMPAGEDPAVNLALAINFFSMNLPEIRDELDVLRVMPGANPTDAEFAKTYNIPNFTSAATAGGGVMTFWNNGRQMDKVTFDHEMAHLMSPKTSSKRAMMPDGYEGAIAQDEKVPSAYSKAAPIEDFAESWALYMGARQTSPEALAKFKEDFPSRAAAMEQFWNRFAPRGEKASANPAERNPNPTVDLKTLEIKREWRKVREEQIEETVPVTPAKPPEAKTEPEAKPPEAKSEPEAKPPEAKSEPEAKPPEVKTQPEAKPPEAKTQPKAKPPVAKTQPKAKPPVAKTQPEAKPPEAKTEAKPATTKSSQPKAPMTPPPKAKPPVAQAK